MEETIRKWIETFMPLLIAVGTVFFGNICVIQPFQEKQWKEQNKLERKNEKQKEAIKYFEILSDLMDKRLFLTRQYFWAIKSEKPDNMKKRNRNLQNFLFEWNTQLNKNIVKTAIYFQNQKEYKFDSEKCAKHCNQDNKSLCECNDKERKECLNGQNNKSSMEIEWKCNIHYNFRCIYENTLKLYRRKPYDEKLKITAENQLDCLNQRIEQFNKHILQSIFSTETKNL